MWRVGGRGYCQGYPERRWWGWRRHWCRTLTAGPAQTQPSRLFPITASHCHIATDGDKVRSGWLGIAVNWNLLSLVTRTKICQNNLRADFPRHFGDRFDGSLSIDLFSFTLGLKPAWPSNVSSFCNLLCSNNSTLKCFFVSSSPFVFWISSIQLNPSATLPFVAFLQSPILCWWQRWSRNSSEYI